MEAVAYNSIQSRKRLRDINTTSSSIPPGELQANRTRSPDNLNCATQKACFTPLGTSESRRSDNSGYTLSGQRPDAAVEPPDVPATAATPRLPAYALNVANMAMMQPNAARSVGSSSTAPISDRIPVNLASALFSGLTVPELHRQMRMLDHQERALLAELHLSRQVYKRRVERLQLSGTTAVVSGGLSKSSQTSSSLHGLQLSQHKPHLSTPLNAQPTAETLPEPPSMMALPLPRPPQLITPLLPIEPHRFAETHLLHQLQQRTRLLARRRVQRPAVASVMM